MTTDSSAPSGVDRAEFACLACGSTTVAWFTKKTKFGDYAVRKCAACRSAFVLPRPTLEEILKLYSDPQGPVEDLIKQRMGNSTAVEWDRSPLFIDGRRIAGRLNGLNAGRKALDIGAGAGYHSRALIQAGFQVDALEPGEVARGVFKAINGYEPIDGFLTPDFAESHAATYDVVLISQVMEHLIDPGQAAQDICRVLRPGGIAAVCVPRFRSWFSILSGRRDMFITPPEHINYFTTDGMKSLMRAHGLAPAFVETVTWFEEERVIARLKSRLLGKAAVAALNVFFAAANAFGGGNTLEAYFRKAG